MGQGKVDFPGGIQEGAKWQRVMGQWYNMTTEPQGRWGTYQQHCSKSSGRSGKERDLL